MKKFYSFILAAAVVLTASAAGRQQAITFTNNKMKAVADVPALNVSNPEAKAVDFKTIAEVNGDYAWSYVDLLSNDSGAAQGVVTITVTDEATGEVTIDGIFGSGTGIIGKIKGTVDLTAGTLTVPNKQFLGNDSYGDPNYFYIKEVADNNIVDGASSAESAIATISGTTFTFPEYCIFAIGDFNDESLGWWKLTYANEFSVYVEPEDTLNPDEWEEVAEATMIDGWIIPGLTYQSGEYAEGADFPMTVKVSRNKENHNLLAVDNPYMKASGFPLSSGTEGNIVFDVTDPDYVLVMPGVYSGYNDGSDRLYCFNIEGFYAELGYSKDVVISGLELTEWSTMKEEDGNTIISIPTCRFNFPGALEKVYSWGGRADAMKATITIKGYQGVENVSYTNDNAPAEYFNLQGMRVDGNAKGILIKKQGNSVSKVIVR